MNNIRLIVNSDDYGRSSEVSRGIRDAHTNGIVSSTTCMMNFPNIDADLALALQETPDLGPRCASRLDLRRAPLAS